MEDVAQDTETCEAAKSMDNTAKAIGTSKDSHEEVTQGTNIQCRMETNKQEEKPMESESPQEASITHETTAEEKLRGKLTRITKHRNTTQTQGTQVFKNTQYLQVTWMPWKKKLPYR